jgi:hypothetical protein
MTKEIKLTQNKVALVSDEDYERLSQWKWCTCKCIRGIYAVRTIRLPSGKHRLEGMHRVIMNAPEGMEVDHIDHDGLNNQRSNLRVATRSQNAANIVANRGVSKFRGVTFLKRNGKWRSAIRVNGKYIYLGSYKAETDAAHAYDTAAREYHREFAQLNFP